MGYFQIVYISSFLTLGSKVKLLVYKCVAIYNHKTCQIKLLYFVLSISLASWSKSSERELATLTYSDIHWAASLAALWLRLVPFPSQWNGKKILKLWIVKQSLKNISAGGRMHPLALWIALLDQKKVLEPIHTVLQPLRVFLYASNEF